jgi:phosphatidylserine/phosphatidylglycerophosphate/cardiolipin synthase-like enzyme
VSVELSVQRVLERLSDAQVEALAEACAAQTAPTPTLGEVASGAWPASHEAIKQLADTWMATPGLTGAGVALALRVGLDARRDADARRSRAVWTGPGASGAQRLTAAVLRDLVTGARERVLLMSFAAYTLADLANDLERAVTRGCQVDVVFETEDDSRGAYSGPHATPFGAVAGVRRWRWPTERREVGALMHAKVLAVDGQRALVGSANLTHRALTANLEAGVLVEDPDLADSIERHVRKLMDEAVLLRLATP